MQANHLHGTSRLTQYTNTMNRSYRGQFTLGSYYRTAETIRWGNTVNDSVEAVWERASVHERNNE